MTGTANRSGRPGIRGSVIVGVGADSASEAALRFGCSAATELRAPLVLMHVQGNARRPKDMLARETHARRLLADAVERARGTIAREGSVMPELLRGGVVQRLLGRSGETDLLVVGRDDGVASAVQGVSIATQVVVQTRSSVVVVPGSWRPDGLPRFVTAAIDVPRWGGAILEKAFRAGEVLHCPVRVVHVTPSAAEEQVWVPGHHGTPPSPEQRAEIRRLLNAAVTRIAAAHPDVSVEVVEEPGWPTAVLERMAEGSALLVLGRHSRPSRPTHTLGVVTGHFVRSSTCPVLVVDPQDMWTSFGGHVVPESSRREAPEPVLMASRTP